MIEKMPDAVVEGAENLLKKVGIDVDLNGDETTVVEEAAEAVSDESEAPAAATE
jgi:hypothetical protein